MRFFSFLLLVGILSCGSKKEKQQTVSKEEFRFSETEMFSFLAAKCDTQFELKETSTYSEFEKFRKTCRVPCLKGCIQIQTDSAYPPFGIRLTPGTHSLGGASWDARKRIFVYVNDRGNIWQSQGGFVSIAATDFKNFDSIVYRFMLAAFDIEKNENKEKINYWPVAVTFYVNTDSVGFMKRHFIDISKGFIYFIREKSLKHFGRPLHELTDSQKMKLSSLYYLNTNIYNSD